MTEDAPLTKNQILAWRAGIYISPILAGIVFTFWHPPYSNNGVEPMWMLSILFLVTFIVLFFAANSESKEPLDASAVRAIKVRLLMGVVYGFLITVSDAIQGRHLFMNGVMAGSYFVALSPALGVIWRKTYGTLKSTKLNENQEEAT